MQQATWGEPSILIPLSLVHDERLSSGDVFVYGAILGNQMSPHPRDLSVADIANLLSRSERSVQRSLRNLEETGCVKVSHRPGKKSTYQGVTELSPLTELSPPSRSNKDLTRAKALVQPAAARRDLLFEALCTVGGHDPKALTRSARGMLNRARKELAEIDATPEEVQARAREYRRKHPDWQLTVPALVKHWDTCRPPKDEEGQYDICSRCSGARWEHDERLMSDYHPFE